MSDSETQEDGPATQRLSELRHDGSLDVRAFAESLRQPGSLQVAMDTVHCHEACPRGQDIQMANLILDYLSIDASRTSSPDLEKAELCFLITVIRWSRQRYLSLTVSNSRAWSKRLTDLQKKYPPQQEESDLVRGTTRQGLFTAASV